MPVLRATLSTCAIVMIGTLAGILVGTGMDHYTAGGLPLEQWLAWRQTRAWVFPTVMPWIFNGTLLLLLLAAVFNRGRSRWAFALAAVLSLVAILVTVRLEVPMNHAISLWTPSTAPADWTRVRDTWMRNHLVRSVAGVAAFVSATAGIVFR